MEKMSCLAPPLPPGDYYVGLLMDAACQLLDLRTSVTVYHDPVFIPFQEPLIFSETDFLKEDVMISIKVYVLNWLLKVVQRVHDHKTTKTTLNASVNHANFAANPCIKVEILP